MAPGAGAHEAGRPGSTAAPTPAAATNTIASPAANSPSRAGTLLNMFGATIPALYTTPLGYPNALQVRRSGQCPTRGQTPRWAPLISGARGAVPNSGSDPALGTLCLARREHQGQEHEGEGPREVEVRPVRQRQLEAQDQGSGQGG